MYLKTAEEIAKLLITQEVYKCHLQGFTVFQLKAQLKAILGVQWLKILRGWRYENCI